MTPQVINVFYRDILAGRLAAYQGGHLWEYDPDFSRQALELSPVRLSTSENRRLCDYGPFMSLPGMVFDALPDSFGLKVMDNAFASLGIVNPTPLQRLAYVGRDGIGALRFEPVMEEAGAKVIELARLAQVVKETQGAKDKTQLQLLRHSTSVGGARPKALVSFDNDKKQYLVGAEPEKSLQHWVVKFQSSEEDDETCIEHALCLLAERCGIRVNATRLVEEKSGRVPLHHFAATRFDIVEGRKLHYHSYAGLMEGDYSGKRNPDYQNLILLAGKLTESYLDRLEMFRRALFNVWVCNNDDHAKNHGFVLDENGWHLSPAFDLTYSMQAMHTDRAMAVVGKINNIARTYFELLAKETDIRPADVKLIVEEVRTGLKQWKAVASKAGLGDERVSEISSAMRDRLSEFDQKK